MRASFHTLAFWVTVYLSSQAACGDTTGNGGTGGTGGSTTTVTGGNGAAGGSGAGHPTGGSGGEGASTTGGNGGHGGNGGTPTTGGGGSGGDGGNGGDGGIPTTGGGGSGGDGGNQTTTGGGGSGGDGGNPTGGGGNGGSGGGGGSGGSGGGSGDCNGDPQGGNDLPDVVVQVPNVTVSTLAGSDVAGSADGDGDLAQFHNPANLVVRPNGDLFVADFDNGMIRQVTPQGHVTTLTSDISFQRPFGMELIDPTEFIVQTDYDELGLPNGLAGGTLWNVSLVTGAPVAIQPDAGRPRGMTATANGHFVISDIVRHDLRIFDPGGPTLTQLAGQNGCPAFADGDATTARFNRPYGMVTLPGGDVLVADQYNHRIRRITPAGDVTTYAGDGTPDMIDGPIATARFNLPQDLAVDAAGNIYVSDTGNHRIRRINMLGVVETVAGDGTAGFANGTGDTAEFFGQEGIAVTANGATVYVADGTNGDPVPYNRIRKISIP